MKLKSLYTGALALAVLCLTSCSDWFDVSPKTNIKANLNTLSATRNIIVTSSQSIQ